MENILTELKNAYGNNAEFREGQQEAIQGVLDGGRLLVVQKTGWGKSLVYFLATKILRKKEKGITLIISPLLALMNNQVDSADKMGLHIETINSGNTEEWASIIDVNFLQTGKKPKNIMGFYRYQPTSEYTAFFV